MFAPSRLYIAAVGYQPVGMKPSTRLSPAFSTFAIATALLSAFATRSRLPSGDRLTWFGVDPGGAFGKSETEICSVGRRAATSIAHTAFVFAQATNSRVPSFEIV